MQRPNIYQAASHISFLKEMFHFQKENMPAFSFAYCARRMKVSASYLKNILSGKRNLSLDHAFSTCEVFGLNSLEQRYFLLMLLRDQTKNTQTRSYFDEVIAKLGAQALEFGPESVFKNANQQNGVLADPLIHLVFSLVALDGFCDDLHWMKTHINDRSYSETQIAEAFTYLLSEGYVAKEGSSYVIKKDCTSTPNPFDPNSFKIYRTGLRQIDRSLEDLLSFRPCQFFMANFAVSQQDMQRVVDAFSRCREEIAAIANESTTDLTHIMSISNNLITISGRSPVKK